uniref:Small ArfGAP 1 n=2 Tax=Scleropages formosus TaxID=113540 RepID=A0A8C9T3V7_SCLFO
MATRSEREKAQKLNEQHQAILAKMLREEDNKYCADCEAKGPRWASWNLGVFICIRCAGIHRNLGVHISRVKSVNLDQWTPEQIQRVQEMGNTRARQLYEANLPESFRRPQTDQAVEFFIRDKYEKKKYYDKNAVSGSNKEREKEEKKEKDPDKGSKSVVNEKSQKRDEIQRDSKASPMKNAEPAVDLLGLDTPAVSSGNSSSNTAPLSDDLDIFGPMVSNPLPSSSAQPNTTTGAPATAAASAAGTVGGSSSTAQGELDLFSESSGKVEDTAKKPLSKDSILSLYSTSGIAQQPTPAGMFMGASQMQFPTQPPSGFQGFPGMGAAMPPTTMMGAVMGQGGTMMGQNAGMMVGMTMPNGFMGGVPAGVMSLAPGMMGPQGGAVPAGVVPTQNMYAMQPGQQGQWTMNQVNQQMSGMSLNGTGAGAAVGFGQPGTWAGPPSGQTLSTQLWKSFAPRPVVVALLSLEYPISQLLRCDTCAPLNRQCGDRF